MADISRTVDVVELRRLGASIDPAEVANLARAAKNFQAKNPGGVGMPDPQASNALFQAGAGFGISELKNTLIQGARTLGLVAAGVTTAIALGSLLVKVGRSFSAAHKLAKSLSEAEARGVAEDVAKSKRLGTLKSALRREIAQVASQFASLKAALLKPDLSADSILGKRRDQLLDLISSLNNTHKRALGFFLTGRDARAIAGFGKELDKAGKGVTDLLRDVQRLKAEANNAKRSLTKVQSSIR